jgi:hypothetical protein
LPWTEYANTPPNNGIVRPSISTCWAARELHDCLRHCQTDWCSSLDSFSRPPPPPRSFAERRPATDDIACSSLIVPVHPCARRRTEDRSPDGEALAQRLPSRDASHRRQSRFPAPSSPRRGMPRQWPSLSPMRASTSPSLHRLAVRQASTNRVRAEPIRSIA